MHVALDSFLDETVAIVIRPLEKMQVGVGEWVTQVNDHRQGTILVQKICGMNGNVIDDLEQFAVEHIPMPGVEPIFVIAEAMDNSIIISGADPSGSRNYAILSRDRQKVWHQTDRIDSASIGQIPNVDRLPAPKMMRGVLRSADQRH